MQGRKPKVLFVSHCAQLSGAELVLCDFVTSCSETSSIFLFEDGPLRAYFEAVGLGVAIGRGLERLLRVRRTGGIGAAIRSVDAICWTAVRLARIARDYEVIYANSQKAFIISGLAALLTRRPLIWHLHDIMTPEHFGWKQIRVAVGLANAIAARVIVPSRAVADAFIVSGGREQKVRIVPNGVLVPPGTRLLEREVLRSELALPEGFLICVAGRLAPWKGQHVILETLAFMLDAQCIIVGDALFGEQDYVNELHRRAATLGVADRIRFLGHRSDVSLLMRASDIVVHTSVKPEPFGRVLVEAMLCGTPVAASRLGAVTEVLGECPGTLLYPAGDATALAKLLRCFRACPERAIELETQSYKRALQLFSVTRMQQEINSVIREVAPCGR